MRRSFFALLFFLSWLNPLTVLARGAPPITVPFDHLKTGFELDGLHRDLPCESCHVNALFKGTPRDCATCHIAGSQFNGTPKTADHIATTNNCIACHNTISFLPGVHFDHSEVRGNCVGCHNGTAAQGKGPAHLKTSHNCAACHAVVSWNPPKLVDHTEIPLAVSGFCIICHNGVQADGKSAGHVATTMECGDCHLTTNWLGASFDHTGITVNCSSCHDGVKAVGKGATHMPTSNVCERCHTSGIGTKMPNWTPALFDHTQMSVTTCATCHNGAIKISTGYVVGQPSNHLPPTPSSVDCGTCHANTPSAETWTTLAGSIATLHTGVSGNCSQCHSNTTFAGMPAPYTPMSITGVSPGKSVPLSPPHIPVLAGADCSGCHNSTYQTAGFGPATQMTSAKHAYVSKTCNTCHEAGLHLYTGSALPPLQGRPTDHNSGQMAAPNDCRTCHTTANWDSGALPAGHMPNPGNNSCTVCHTKAPADFTASTLAAAPILHTGISTGCMTCHGAPNVAAPVFYPNYTPKDALLAPPHIPTGATPCEDCHAASFSTFAGATMTASRHTAMFAFIGNTCDACHNAVTPPLTFYGVTHLTTRPGGHNSGKEKTSDCNGCHTANNWDSGNAAQSAKPGSRSKISIVAKPPAVPEIAAGRSASSGTPVAAPAALSHLGVTSNCESCHNGLLASGKSAGHILSNIPCQNCHSTVRWLPAHFDHRGVAQGCLACHNGALAQGEPLAHLPSSKSCDACHGTMTWRPARFDHATGNENCTTCHNGVSAAGKPVQHPSTAQDCSRCHTVTAWMVVPPRNALRPLISVPHGSSTPKK